VASLSNDVDDIRRDMAQLRMTLHHDMREVVAEAEAATDWRAYVRRYPWVYLGAAMAAGFLLVPGRRSSIHATVQAAANAAAEKVKDDVTASSPETRRPPSRGRGVFGLVVDFVAPLALRAAQGYAIQYLEAALGGQSAGPPAYPSEPANKGANRNAST
jgi:hypothetical protein